MYAMELKSWLPIKYCKTYSITFLDKCVIDEFFAYVSIMSVMEIFPLSTLGSCSRIYANKTQLLN